MICLREKEGTYVLPEIDQVEDMLLCYIALTIVVRKKCIAAGYSDVDIYLTEIVSKIVETDEFGEHWE